MERARLCAAVQSSLCRPVLRSDHRRYGSTHALSLCEREPSSPRLGSRPRRVRHPRHRRQHLRHRCRLLLLAHPCIESFWFAAAAVAGAEKSLRAEQKRPPRLPAVQSVPAGAVEIEVGDGELFANGDRSQSDVSRHELARGCFECATVLDVGGAAVLKLGSDDVDGPAPALALVGVEGACEQGAHALSLLSRIHTFLCLSESPSACNST
mmetsp:Transcript_3112/g.11286  ORF Transcript_3112/g.11286 Transcript_3112/m.11286 type:complete len:210 (+) Transcript_3112:240-869(+)